MELMSGNEAIAQGAWEAGARIGVAYPGTPSTETLEAFAKKDGVYAEWCVNEKVAVEVGIGASAAGARVLTTMKHVGVNVAADPLFTAAYAGVGGGLVVLAADDPGMYSSQNEQDSHWYARAAHIPMLDPADSAEALRFTREAYELSERFDVPVFIRSTVRVSHTKTPVEPGARAETALKPYESDPAKWVMMPAFAKPRRKVQLARIDALRAWAEECPYNEVVRKGSAVGVVCAGAVYQHVVEALPDASVFKLGLTWPLPQQALRDFAESVDALYVVEEASEYLDEGVRALGIEVAAFGEPRCRDGRTDPGLIRAAFGFEEPAHEPLPAGLPGRPPALCAGCPHRLVFKELSRMKAVVTGDIGCYTLGALPPLSAMDTTIDMGASVSMSHGFELACGHRPPSRRGRHRRLDVRALGLRRRVQPRTRNRRGQPRPPASSAPVRLASPRKHVCPPAFPAAHGGAVRRCPHPFNGAETRGESAAPARCRRCRPWNMGASVSMSHGPELAWAGRASSWASPGTRTICVLDTVGRRDAAEAARASRASCAPSASRTCAPSTRTTPKPFAARSRRPWPRRSFPCSCSAAPAC